jgi:hypothetical protein
MRSVVLILSAAVFTTSLVSCKNDKTTQITDTPDIEETITSEDLALANVNETDTNTGESFMYVTAFSGLSLREYANLQSEKLGRMPYGTKVRVLHSEENPTMNVNGLKGGMNEVEFNHKKGFAFNGYLSKYFPPERDITVSGYASELNKLFPDVIYKETTGGTASNPVTTETISLPEARWHEAYFIAQRLFDFPKEFTFPNPRGKKTEVIFDGKPKKGVWTSQLEITRSLDELEKIEYVYGAKQFDSRVSIEKEGNVMLISKTESIK